MNSVTISSGGSWSIRNLSEGLPWEGTEAWLRAAARQPCLLDKRRWLEYSRTSLKRAEGDWISCRRAVLLLRGKQRNGGLLCIPLGLVGGAFVAGVLVKQSEQKHRCHSPGGPGEKAVLRGLSPIRTLQAFGCDDSSSKSSSDIHS